MKIRIQSGINNQPFSSKEVSVETDKKTHEAIMKEIDQAKVYLDYIESLYNIPKKESTSPVTTHAHDTIKAQMEETLKFLTYIKQKDPAYKVTVKDDLIRYSLPRHHENT